MPGPALHGAIPPDPATGFDGLLYLAGERLVPGSIVHVAVNGVPTKVLPAVFVSSELIGVYVYLTVPADYTLTAVAPDGTPSAPLQLTVPAGTPTALLGLDAPDVQMVFPTDLHIGFDGVVWLMGEKFMPGSTLLISRQGSLSQVQPLLFVNERVVGWAAFNPLPGDVDLQVVNPTLLSSPPLRLTVAGGAAPAAAAPPTVVPPTGVSSPFVGSIQLFGQDLAPGAALELRSVARGPSSSTPLVWVSQGEAWWSLIYPRPGAYEARVVNPGGGASGWWPFQVR